MDINEAFQAVKDRYEATQKEGYERFLKREADSIRKAERRGFYQAITLCLIINAIIYVCKNTLR